jgi:hypothetical protein
MPKNIKNVSNVCEICKEAFVVNSLARVCEEKHNSNLSDTKPDKK